MSNIMDSVSKGSDSSHSTNISTVQDEPSYDDDSSSLDTLRTLSSSSCNNRELINRVYSINKRLTDMASSFISVMLISNELSYLAMERIDKEEQHLDKEEIEVLKEIISEKHTDHADYANLVSSCSSIKSNMSFLITPYVLEAEKEEGKKLDDDMLYSIPIYKHVSHLNLDLEDRAKSKLSKSIARRVLVALNEADTIHTKIWRFLRVLYKFVDNFLCSLQSSSITSTYLKEINEKLDNLSSEIENPHCHNKKTVETIKNRIILLERRKKFVLKVHSSKSNKYKYHGRLLICYIKTLEKTGTQLKYGIKHVESYKECISILEAHHIVHAMLGAGYEFLKKYDVFNMTERSND